ncbi:unnamed protein product [Cylicocyclus nassatus]|uniref:SXP/RAL-2 family protein Ani s 5-like cation-binding domain-containing protein n=1 Tax=Cylicocyclus nassatus TaxID=53992 RepID=A0AA36DQK8_CYLNA|nr:unnamed protein product [Cylicocyclus nassatus]
MQYLIRIVVITLALASVMAWRGNKVYDDNEEPDLPGCDHHDRHRHHHMPAFLKKVSKEARLEYYEIMWNFSTSMQDKLDKLSQWAKKNNVEDAVNQWVKKIENFWEEVNKNTTKTLHEMTEVYPKVYKILSDMSLTPKEMILKVRDLHMDCTLTRTLYQVVFTIARSSGKWPYMGVEAEDYFGKLMGTRAKKQAARVLPFN